MSQVSDEWQEWTISTLCEKLAMCWVRQEYLLLGAQGQRWWCHPNGDKQLHYHSI